MMRRINKRWEIGLLLALSVLLVSSCKKQLVPVNINPNEATVDGGQIQGKLVLSTVLSKTGQQYVDLGFGTLMGTMQYTLNDGNGGSTYNQYHWESEFNWNTLYLILSSNEYVIQKARDDGNTALEGVALTMKAMIFGHLAGMYGDVPYDAALHGDEEGQDNWFPPFTTQEDVFKGVLKQLDTANTLLSQPDQGAGFDFSDADIYYGGKKEKWRKFANSIALRYYWRLSERIPDYAREGVERIVNNPSDYPIITEVADNCLMGFPGNNDNVSWPRNVIFQADSSDYRRIKMGAAFVNQMLEWNDPRIGQWAQKVKEMIKIVPGSGVFRSGMDTTVDGEARKVLFLSSDQVSGDIDTNTNYVGIPIFKGTPYAYNMSTDVQQNSHNKHVSWLNPIYMQSSGPLLKARLMTASEVHFILAEAKTTKTGWNLNVNAEEEYNKAIKASFDEWTTEDNQMSDKYNAYIQQPEIAYNGTQKQIMLQKWIANWTRANESWADYLRTGYPQIHGLTGVTRAPEIPLRANYPSSARSVNKENHKVAAANLEPTALSEFGSYGKQSSPWSRTWLLQTGNDDIPWNR